MGGLAASGLGTGLSAALTVIVALLLFLAEARGPLSASIRASRGLVAPYFT